MNLEGVPNFTSTASLHGGNFVLTARTFINSNSMCPVESVVPILASACQVNTDMRRFVENETNDGLREFCNTILAFKNPTKISLRTAKNTVRDIILDNSERFFNGISYARMPYYNISILFDGLSLLSDSLRTVIGLTLFQSSVCSDCGFQSLGHQNHFVCDVGGWLDIFPKSMKIIGIEAMIDSISQRNVVGSCIICGLTNTSKSEYFDPKRFVIFSATIGMERIYWNREITIKQYRYRMIGVTRAQGAHFCGEVFDHTSRKWLHYNSCYESKRDRAKGYTLKSISLKRRSHFEGVFQRRCFNTLHQGWVEYLPEPELETYYY